MRLTPTPASMVAVRAGLDWRDEKGRVAWVHLYRAEARSYRLDRFMRTPGNRRRVPDSYGHAHLVEIPAHLYALAYRLVSAVIPKGAEWRLDEVLARVAGLPRAADRLRLAGALIASLDLVPPEMNFRDIMGAKWLAALQQTAYDWTP